MRKYDPDEVFMNNFGRRLQGASNRMSTDPRVTHCALLDDCVCSTNQDCAPRQICSRISGYPDYPVCMNPGKHVTFLDPDPRSIIPEGMSLNELYDDWNLTV